MKRTAKLSLYLSLVVVSFISTASTAQALEDSMTSCLMSKLNAENLDKTLRELKQECTESFITPGETKSNKVINFFDLQPHNSNLAIEPYVMTPYVMTPHRMNYLLPVSYSDNINREPYDIVEGWADHFKDIEVKYQLSFRVPLLTESLFTEGDGVAFAFTLQSWWQIYAQTISRPFRETNYQPEIFYYTPLSWEPLGGNTALLLGFEHQSNGHSSYLSRSWNRIYANFVFAKGDYALSLIHI